MIKEVKYFNEVIVGRVGKVERVDNRINVSVVENFDQRDADPKWINMAAFDGEKIKLAERGEKALKPGAIAVFFVQMKENGEYKNRVINDFKIAKWPAKQE